MTAGASFQVLTLHLPNGRKDDELFGKKEAKGWVFYNGAVYISVIIIDRSSTFSIDLWLVSKIN